MNFGKSIIIRVNALCVHHQFFVRKASKLSSATKGFYSPSMNDEEIRKINSVLGVNIGLTSIAWARIEVKDSSLTHLDYQMLPENMNKLDPNEIYFLILKISQSLPKADKFVLEAVRKQFNIAGGHLNLSLQATRFQVISTLVSVLNHESRKGTDDDDDDAKIHPILFLKYRLAGKLFDLLIGHELLACKDTVMDLLVDEFEGTPNPSTSPYSVKTSEDVVTKYKKASDVGKELMGRAFLETLTFTELVIRKNPGSYKKLEWRL